MPLTVSKAELLVDGEDHLFRQAVHDALGFSARLQEIRNRLGEVIGLSGPAYSILIAIEHLGQQGEVGVSKVGEHLHLSGAFVTIEVNKLVKSGLVDKVPHHEDGRRVVLTVTGKARSLLDELAATQCPVNDTIFDGLSANQFRAFAQIIASLVGGTEEALALLRLQAEQRRRQA
ncbi:MarR family transcriptional regulator [Sphingobium sp. SA2]|uniref:MarR family winged helix-turn-helix transcriptional regulator n=1 Tax=unclassified Sphingobium TaxID=2611147 RepID=UPI000BB56385|nr:MULTISPECIES: MarR family transcriptional regulator [unclassified Sphingobium]MDT7532132.1 MarR family transcriptional regulator [Sphingobium sp. SA2]PBN45243.1 MarR family transcriptional regulator [Sphingobium sp. D43FB]